MLVYLIGNKRSGKTTHAEWLVKHQGFKRMSLADPIRDMAAWIISRYCGDTPPRVKANLLQGELYNHFKEATVQCGDFRVEGTRRLLEGIGEGACEFIHTHVWLDAIKERVKASSYEKVVVDDVRKPFEAVGLDSIGGQGIFLSKPDSDCPNGTVTEICQHNVDTGLIQPSLTVDFSLGIEETQKRIRKLIAPVGPNPTLNPKSQDTSEEQQ